MSPAARRSAAAALTVALGAAGLTGCGGSSSSAPTAPASSGSVRSTATAPRTPEITLPPSVASLLPSLPAAPTGSQPCAAAGTPFTAASAYLALAQLGQTALAQRCVRGDAVTATTTKTLVARSVAEYFVPSGPTSGNPIAFRRVDATRTATITLTRSGDHYLVTGVAIG